MKVTNFERSRWTCTWKDRGRRPVWSDRWPGAATCSTGRSGRRQRPGLPDRSWWWNAAPDCDRRPRRRHSCPGWTRSCWRCRRRSWPPTSGPAAEIGDRHRSDSPTRWSWTAAGCRQLNWYTMPPPRSTPCHPPSRSISLVCFVSLLLFVGFFWFSNVSGGDFSWSPFLMVGARRLIGRASPPNGLSHLVGGVAQKCWKKILPGVSRSAGAPWWSVNLSRDDYTVLDGMSICNHQLKVSIYDTDWHVKRNATEHSMTFKTAPAVHIYIYIYRSSYLELNCTVIAHA